MKGFRKANITGVCLFFLMLSVSNAQTLIENFDDTNFTSNPAWTGDTSDFIINSSLQLQLNASSAGISYLSTSQFSNFNTVWQFWFKLDFAPSANNLVKIYLVSNQQNLTSSLKGYYLQLGESGSQDGIDLFKQNGLNSVKIIDGHATNLSQNPEIHVKVIHDPNGEWTLYTSGTSLGPWQEEGRVFDNEFTENKSFGFLCKYTISNSHKFYFDSIQIYPYQPDTLAPTLQSIEFNDFHSLVLKFNENLDSLSSGKKENFYLWPDFVYPSKVKYGGNYIQLFFSQAFENEKFYSLVIKNIKDLQGNALDSLFKTFEFFLPSRGSIVINEIMADPSPSVQLPEEEYIELFNTTNHDITLGGWVLSDPSTSIILPDTVIEKGQYLILCRPEALQDFAPYGHVLPSGIPVLNNSGDELHLVSTAGLNIDDVHYLSSWYRNPDKSSGGWSLERINPYNPCGKEENWTASEDAAGGTPGKINSVFQMIPDSIPPVISSYMFTDSGHIEIHFSEPVDTVQPFDFQFECSKQVMEINWLSTEILEMKIYPVFHHQDTCTLTYHVFDCIGNASNHQIFIQYFKPEQASAFDIVVSEIMANPEPAQNLPPFEYLELYNRSQKYVNLDKWYLQINNAQVRLPNFLVKPGDYVILCDENYMNSFQAHGQVVGVHSMPSLPNSGGRILLYNSQHQYIFDLSYSSRWYQNEYKAGGGWSLEMKDVHRTCNQEGNWSASESPSGGTPGKQNSVMAQNPDLDDPVINAVFCPDSLHLELVFNEKLDSLSATLTKNFEFSDNTPSVQGISCPVPDYNRLLFEFKKPLNRQETYQLALKNVSDCSGNFASPGPYLFGLEEPVDSGDLIINEILFNPIPGGSDFIELFNRSNKIINLNQLVLASLDDSVRIVQPVTLSSEGNLIFPGDYPTFTVDPDFVKENYLVKHENRLLGLSKLPSFNDDKGDVVLMNRQNQVLDYLHYEESYHSSLLKNKEGVSLERISPDQPTGLPSNWYSASTDAGYATPTYRNSQYSEETPGNQMVEIEPTVFSPDFDGMDDLLFIRYKLPRSGYHGSIDIYNLSGKKIKEISNHFLAGTQGFFTWDGTTDDGQLSPIGVYIVVVILNHPEQNTVMVKKAVTLYLKN